jgi:uncharacterized protein with NRDE domain
MCLAAMAIGCHPRFPFVLASNRDEFHDRPSTPLAWWQPVSGGPTILSGRDLSAGGTWLGLTRAGQLALVTNVREPGRFNTGLPSRGDLVLQWLAAPDFDAGRLQAVAATPRNGFNLLVADLAQDAAAWAGNRPPQAQRLTPGFVGLSNAALDTPWPKVTRLKARLASAVGSAVASRAGRDDLLASLLAALADAEAAPDAQLPATGVPLDRERQLSPAFIHIPADSGHAAYGTRCATVVVAEQHADGRELHVLERRFSAQAQAVGDTAMHWRLPAT